MKKETKAVLIVVFMFLITIGVMISKLFAGILGVILLGLVSWIFFLVAKDEKKDLSTVKEFLETGKVRSDKFKVVSGIVRKGGIVRIDDADYAVYVRIGRPLKISMNDFPDKIKEIQHTFDDLVGHRIEFLVRKIKERMKVYAIRNYHKRTFWNGLRGVTLFTLLGIILLLIAPIPLLITLGFNVATEYYIALIILSIPIVYLLLFSESGPIVELEVVSSGFVNPFWDFQLFRKQYSDFIRYQKGRFIELIGFIISVIIFFGVIIIAFLSPETCWILVNDYYRYFISILVVIPMIIAEVIAMPMKSEYNRRLFRESAIDVIEMVEEMDETKSAINQS